MSRVLVVADDPWVVSAVHSALSIGGNELIDHGDPSTAAVATGASQLTLRSSTFRSHRWAAWRSPGRSASWDDPVPVVMLLDREADVFLAGRAGANAWVVKPFSVFALRTAVADASGAV